MIVRTYVAFRSDLADKGVETEDGFDFVEWPGKPHIVVMADILQALGWKTAEPITAEHAGWDLQAELGRKSIWLRAQFAEEDKTLLMLEDLAPERTWYLARKPPGPVFTGLLTALDGALRADGRFHGLRWFTPKEYIADGLGTPTPVSDIKEMAG